MSVYESWCPSCKVSNQPNAKRCIHCGGPTAPSREAPGARRGVPLEMRRGADDAEEGGERAPRIARILLAVVWVLVAVGASLYRACTGS